jgi:NTP pyrophosphatase (non-canonical NTP hydrolase)
MSKTIDLDKLRAYQRAFVKERDWEKFHSPKNLAMALAGESGELLEIFQWLSEKESFSVARDAKLATQVRHELADIFYYVARLADVLEIDLEEAFWEKMRLNEKKYPVAQSKGSARKYTEF